MKSVNILSLKHQTGELLEHIALGGQLKSGEEINPSRYLKPMNKGKPDTRPDFRDRIQAIYGKIKLKQTATELLNDECGNR